MVGDKVSHRICKHQLMPNLQFSSKKMVQNHFLSPLQVIEDEKAWDWLPFPCAIPWRDIVLTIYRDEFLQNPVESITKLISSITEERLLQLQKLSNYHAADIDWTAHNSRVLDNLLRESYYIPCRSFEENVTDKTWSAEQFDTLYDTRGLTCN